MASPFDVAKLTDWFVEAGADRVTMKLADEVVLPSLTVTSPMLTPGVIVSYTMAGWLLADA